MPNLLARITKLARRLGADRSRHGAMRREAVAREEGAFDEPRDERARGFERDYRAAVDLLRIRVNQAHPAAFHRKLSRRGSSNNRVAVVDDASTAIAVALRDGASVEHAAEMGASRLGV